MTANPAKVRWGLVLWGLAPPLAAMGSTFLVIFAYAAAQAFKVRGQPDPQRIAQFANQVGPIGGPILTIVFTAAAATWLAHRARGSRREGLLIGLVAALLVLAFGWGFGGRVDGLDLLAAAATVGAGWAGARVAAGPDRSL